MLLCKIWIFGFLTSWFPSAFALDIDLKDYKTLQNASALVAKGLMDYYTGEQYGQTIGMFSWPYYWWEAGGAWNSLIDYWFYMQNDTYNDQVTQALLYQSGENHDYVPLNQSTVEGNDDQAFWGIAVLNAAERKFPNPPADQPQWLYLAQAVFNTMALRWDMTSCNGGLRWQIFTWNSGYDYKNTVSNGALFHIAARLAYFTGNSSYVDWADKIYNWMDHVHLIEPKNNDQKFVYDGVEATNNCSGPVTRYVWTYNQGLVMSGCAYLYKETNDERWYNKTKAFLDTTAKLFYNKGVLFEYSCQSSHSCNTDQRSFKAYYITMLAATAQLIPDFSERIMGLINSTAYGAAQSCVGGYDGHTCGIDWNQNGWDGQYGLGEQMAALEALVVTQAMNRPAPYNSTNGGNSTGDGAAGTQKAPTNLKPLHITSGSRAGAGIITCVVGFSIIASFLWLVM
ncbi:hydrolase 76 protein [Zygosaccharomyces mellis]|uniref:Mannan endo-1,6-alpha-mannosidase n=1 Tax=Zygosaccharomyces mellis TaxID=42258 RepID=A0A4C2E7P0_9SACH|nr:hydrolase 76 protein [Zygosaccharomyces mellis]